MRIVLQNYERVKVSGRKIGSLRADPENLIYKFRYAAKVYSHIYGIDYFEILAPTTIVESVRILMQLVVNFDLLLPQMGVKSAYSQAPFKCDVYICQPPGFEKLETNQFGNLASHFMILNKMDEIGVIYCTIF